MLPCIIKRGEVRDQSDNVNAHGRAGCLWAMSVRQYECVGENTSVLPDAFVFTEGAVTRDVLTGLWIEGNGRLS